MSLMRGDIAYVVAQLARIKGIGRTTDIPYNWGADLITRKQSLFGMLVLLLSSQNKYAVRYSATQVRL